jgi:predicted DNA-binding transcriptional regulator AlpA
MASTTDNLPNDALASKLADAGAAKERLISRREFCAFCGIGYSTSEVWARKGIGPRPVKLGLRRVGYRLSDVLAFTRPTAA